MLTHYQTEDYATKLRLAALEQFTDLISVMDDEEARGYIEDSEEGSTFTHDIRCLNAGTSQFECEHRVSGASLDLELRASVVFDASTGEVLVDETQDGEAFN